MDASYLDLLMAQQEEVAEEDRVRMGGAMLEAVDANLDLEVSQKFVEAGEERVKADDLIKATAVYSRIPEILARQTTANTKTQRHEGVTKFFLKSGTTPRDRRSPGDSFGPSDANACLGEFLVSSCLGGCDG